ncbi:MAG: DUF1579 domain-containing protein [Bdellovibrionales bacterium]|nr:DUF1579 domain-containing protein [Bdellovibrionales bacterium]
MKRIAIALLLGAGLIGCSQSSSKMAEPKMDEMAMKKPEMVQMSPEEMKAKMELAATPGAEHKALAPLVGKWKTETKMWMDPSKQPEVTMGTAQHNWVLGGRFVQEQFSGKFHGQPFQGSGMIGFDKVKGEYVSTWTDTMGTGIMNGEGKFDPAKKEIEMSSTFSCPVTGGEKSSRSVTRIISNNEHVFEMFSEGPDGKEFKMLEIKYKRQG